MTIVLNEKNKYKIITKEYPEPALNSPLRALWERNNDMIISPILNTITNQISNNLSFINSAYALWLELQDHYSQLDGHRIYQLSNDVAQLKQLNFSVEVRPNSNNRAPTTRPRAVNMAVGSDVALISGKETHKDAAILILLLGVELKLKRWRTHAREMFDPKCVVMGGSTRVEEGHLSLWWPT
nr:cysteine-rich RLK (receptor-like protein kinase) 8 [Tanacetum cinerariifolium]